MAPDKIYIDIIDMDSGYMVAPSFENNGCAEYIRKDALFEWLEQGFDWIKNPVISVQQIIDKLNSM